MSDEELISVYLVCKKELIKLARENMNGALLNILAPSFKHELRMFEIMLGEFIYETENGVKIGSTEYVAE